MNLVNLTEYIIKSIVKEPDLVSIKSFEKDDNTVIEVLVSAQDMGFVIGSKGKTINAIRTVIEICSYINNNKKIVINVDTI